MGTVNKLLCNSFPLKDQAYLLRHIPECMDRVTMLPLVNGEALGRMSDSSEFK